MVGDGQACVWGYDPLNAPTMTGKYLGCDFVPKYQDFFLYLLNFYFSLSLELAGGRVVEEGDSVWRQEWKSSSCAHNAVYLGGV